MTGPSDGQALRTAREGERAALEALQLRASLAWGDHVQELTDHPDAVTIDPAHLPHTVVLEADGVVLGFGTVLVQQGAAELDGLFVEPACSGRGHGRRLLARLERLAEQAGARRLDVVANARAIPFYERCGFTLTGEVMTRFAVAPTMSKRLG
jgi:ribosomal protein S18 acetylase RimI-like enzyme